MDLYYNPASAACRAVLLTAKVVGAELNLKPINTMKGEQLTPEYLKMNPQHTIPTLVDGDFVLWESRAILAYLAEKYGNDSLYPKDIKTRALINQRLYFDIGCLTERLTTYFKAKVLKKMPYDPEMFKSIEGAVEFLNKFLEGNEFVVGNNLTIADISLFATVTTCELVGVDLSQYSNITKWYKNCLENIPGIELNNEGLEFIRKFIESQN